MREKSDTRKTGSLGTTNIFNFFYWKKIYRIIESILISVSCYFSAYGVGVELSLCFCLLHPSRCRGRVNGIGKFLVEYIVEETKSFTCLEILLMGCINFQKDKWSWMIYLLYLWGLGLIICSHFKSLIDKLWFEAYFSTQIETYVRYY